MDDSTESLLWSAQRVLESGLESLGVHVGSPPPAHGLAFLEAKLTAFEGQLRELAAGRSADDDVAQWAAGAELLLRESALVRNDLLTRELGRRHEAMDRVQKALQRLRRATSVDELVCSIPYEVAGLGYDRALFSWVDQMRWITHSAHSLSGPEEGRLFVQVGQQRPFQHLRGLFEFEVVQRRATILRQGVRESAHVHPELIKVTQSDTYIAAPLVSGRAVVGLVHVDRHADKDPLGEFDRELISVFCEGAGIALERIRALEGISSLQRDISRNSDSLNTLLEKLGQLPGARTSPGPEDQQGDVVSVPKAQPSFGFDSMLTRREEQVLELLSRGLTNGQIGDRLYITEATAKVHVKNVLRKLGVANRTEAAALYRQ
ncbi:LuxR C-terminal-related transcriptional regulator [bacterium RCC_150]